MIRLVHGRYEPKNRISGGTKPHSSTWGLGSGGNAAQHSVPQNLSQMANIEQPVGIALHCCKIQSRITTPVIFSYTETPPAKETAPPFTTRPIHDPSRQHGLLQDKCKSSQCSENGAKHKDSSAAANLQLLECTLMAQQNKDQWPIDLSLSDLSVYYVAVSKTYKHNILNSMLIEIAI